MRISLYIYYLLCNIAFAEKVKDYDELKQELHITGDLEVENITIERVTVKSSTGYDQQLTFMTLDSNISLFKLAEMSEIFKNVKPSNFILKEKLYEFEMVPNSEESIDYNTRYEGLSSYWLSRIEWEKTAKTRIAEAVIIQTNSKSSKLKKFKVFICYYQAPTNGLMPSRKIIRKVKGSDVKPEKAKGSVRE